MDAYSIVEYRKEKASNRGHKAASDSFTIQSVIIWGLEYRIVSFKYCFHTACFSKTLH